MKNVVYMKRISKWCADPKCLKHHIYVPATAKYQFTKGDPLSGWYWNCDCGTTMFIQDEEYHHEDPNPPTCA